jgi:hypothetical protein
MTDITDLLEGLPGSPVDFSAAERRIEQRTKSRALVVMAHGKGLCVSCEPGVALDFIHENDSTATEDGFVLDQASVDYCETLPDGVYYGVLVLLDDGPGDAPGSREFFASLTSVRLATAEEWHSHLRGEWAWDPQAEAT